MYVSEERGFCSGICGAVVIALGFAVERVVDSSSYKGSFEEVLNTIFQQL